MRSRLLPALALSLAAAVPSLPAAARQVDDWFSSGALENFARVTAAGRGWVITSTGGRKLKLTPYSDAMLRVQAVDQGQDFLADDHYEMVLRHDVTTSWTMAESASDLRFLAADGSCLEVV